MRLDGSVKDAIKSAGIVRPPFSKATDTERQFGRSKRNTKDI
jgi:hypothetical protein